MDLNELTELKGGNLIENTKNIFCSYIDKFPDLLKTHRFQVYFNDIPFEIANDFMFRIQACCVEHNQIIITLNEFEDLFILKHEKELKNVNSLIIKFYDKDLATCIGNIEYNVEYDHIAYALNLTITEPVRPSLYFKLR